MSDPTSLVNFTLPTNAPRQIHGPMALAVSPTGNGTVSRSLHTLDRVREVTGPFSCSSWQSFTAIFVPRPGLTNVTFHITAAFSADDMTPTSELALWNAATCSFITFGGSGEPLKPQEFHLNFVASATSSLVKPAPQFQHRAALVFHLTVTDSDSGGVVTDDRPDGYMNVMFRGTLEQSGQA